MNFFNELTMWRMKIFLKNKETLQKPNSAWEPYISFNLKLCLWNLLSLEISSDNSKEGEHWDTIGTCIFWNHTLTKGSLCQLK